MDATHSTSSAQVARLEVEAFSLDSPEIGRVAWLDSNSDLQHALFTRFGGDLYTTAPSAIAQALLDQLAEWDLHQAGRGPAPSTHVADMDAVIGWYAMAVAA